MLNVIAELLTKYFCAIKKNLKESKTDASVACCRFNTNLSHLWVLDSLNVWVSDSIYQCFCVLLVFTMLP